MEEICARYVSLYVVYLYAYIYIVLYTPFLHCTYHPHPLYIRTVCDTQKIWRSATRKPRRMKYRTRAAILFSNKKALILPSKLLLYYVYVQCMRVRVYREVYMMVRILCNVICILPGTRAHITQGNSSGVRVYLFILLYTVCAMVIILKRIIHHQNHIHFCTSTLYGSE